METSKEDEEETKNGRTIPHDIVFDILTRLPVKSLSRFRCVSKLWNSTISDKHFIKSHHHRTSSRSDGATLLITFPDNRNLARSLYTATDNSENDDGPVAFHLLAISGFVHPYVSESLNGLICLQIASQLRICNPSTREFITLPTTETTSTTFSHYNLKHFGYDPINNQHKVLNTWVIETGDPGNEFIMEHRVFVLGTHSWRRIGDGPPHLSHSDVVCVNGILYYRAWTSMVSPRSEVLVAFDVRLETFRFIQMPSGDLQLYFDSALIRFEGHLAIVDYQCLKYGNFMEIWVLEDSLKLNWVYKILDLSSAWTDSQEGRDFYLAGTSRTGELIMVEVYIYTRPFNCLEGENT